MSKITNTSGSFLDAVNNLTQSGSFNDYSAQADTTAATIANAHDTRSYLFIQNLGTANIYVNFTDTATAGAGSIRLVPGASMDWKWPGYVPSGSVNIIADTSSQAFTCKEA